MRKLFCLLICVMLLAAMTVSAHAEDTDPSQNPSTEASEPGPTEHVCSWGEGVVTREATCTENGERTYTCSCGATKTEVIPATGHTYGTGVKLDDTNHEAVCTVCVTKGTFAHEWEVSETIDASCQQTGLKRYICTGCNATKQEVLEKTAHNYSVKEYDDICHTIHCADCGHEETADHAVSVQETPATCKSKGSKVSTCSVCSWSVTEELPMLTTHTYDNDCDASCNVCGTTRAVEHKYTTAWSSDYSTHWKECTKCKLKKDVARHVPGPAATEENPQLCTVCKYEITPVKAHTHKYETKWTTDEVGHWHECSGANCKDEKDYASHEYDDDCDEECNVCNYKREANHIYEDWLSDEVEHWQICTVCEKETEHEGHVPGEEATDEAAQLCTVCDYEITPIQEHTHDFGNDWVQAEESHWQECKCGELSVPEPHVWDAGIENSREDTITYSCTVCGAEKTEEAPSSGFPWIIVFILLALVCIGGIIAIVIILKRSEYEDDDEYEEE